MCGKIFAYTDRKIVLPIDLQVENFALFSDSDWSDWRYCTNAIDTRDWINNPLKSDGNFVHVCVLKNWPIQHPLRNQAKQNDFEILQWFCTQSRSKRTNRWSNNLNSVLRLHVESTDNQIALFGPSQRTVLACTHEAVVEAHRSVAYDSIEEKLLSTLLTRPESLIHKTMSRSFPVKIDDDHLGNSCTSIGVLGKNLCWTTRKVDRIPRYAEPPWNNSSKFYSRYHFEKMNSSNKEKQWSAK